MDSVLKTRSITGILFGIVVIGLLLMGEWGYALLAAVTSLIGNYEYNKMAGKSDNAIFLGIGLTLIAITVVMKFFVPDYLKDALLGFTILFYSFFMVNVLTSFRLDHKKLLPIFGLVYPTIALLMPLIHSDEKVWKSNFWLYAIILIWISDVGAYLVGRKLGKTKLIEKVSPKKTVEGSIGAGIFTVIGGIIIYFTSHSFNLTFWIVTAITIWIIGTFGDLYESTIKRKYDAKDSGDLLPGHGGFLDRFDSLIFAAPFLVLILKIFKNSI